MNSIRFLRPETFWLLPAALAMAGIWRMWIRRQFAAATTVRLLTPRIYRASLVRELPIACVAAALVFVTVALMDPVLPYAEARLESRGLDIVVALDLSSSMGEEIDEPLPSRTTAGLTFTNRPVRRVTDSDAEATRPGTTRLAATKDALRGFVAERRGDRVGLIVFSENAYVVSPLSFDHDYVLRYVDMVDVQMLQGEGMTAIGEGIALANQLLARQSTDQERRNRVVVVFTDGENNFGRDPVEAIKEADAANTRVHLVTVDLAETIRSKAEVRQLVRTVRQYGGQHFGADTARDVGAASRAISTLEKGYLTHTRYVRNVPVYDWFALPALLCLALAFAVRAIPYFVDLT